MTRDNVNELQNALAEILGREKTRAKTLLVPSFLHSLSEQVVATTHYPY